MFRSFKITSISYLYSSGYSVSHSISQISSGDVTWSNSKVKPLYLMVVLLVKIVAKTYILVLLVLTSSSANHFGKYFVGYFGKSSASSFFKSMFSSCD